MRDPNVHEQLGPLATAAPVRALYDLTERTWGHYKALIAAHERPADPSVHFLLQRMMYISEVTSRAVRLNLSWGLVHPAMSLTRDRYEQLTRFSWLARQPNGNEVEKYRRYFYGKVNSLLKDVPEQSLAKLEAQFGPTPAWATKPLTKDERVKLREWESLDLRAMATKRDGLPALSDLPIAKDNLATMYGAIYGQFSSISHFDMLSLQFVRTKPGPDGTPVFDTEPHWPALLVLQNCRMDIIQCFESSKAYYAIDSAEEFKDLFLACLRSSHSVLGQDI
jgi:hypothetical protein